MKGKDRRQGDFDAVGGALGCRHHEEGWGEGAGAVDGGGRWGGACVWGRCRMKEVGRLSLVEGGEGRWRDVVRHAGEKQQRVAARRGDVDAVIGVLDSRHDEGGGRREQVRWAVAGVSHCV